MYIKKNKKQKKKKNLLYAKRTQRVRLDIIYFAETENTVVK